jgi:hypothetical protein
VDRTVLALATWTEHQHIDRIPQLLPTYPASLLCSELKFMTKQNIHQTLVAVVSVANHILIVKDVCSQYRLSSNKKGRPTQSITSLFRSGKDPESKFLSQMLELGLSHLRISHKNFYLGMNFNSYPKSVRISITINV